MTTLTCPAVPPALTCAGWRPDYRPSGVHELQSLFLERGEAIRCRDAALELWETLHAECASGGGGGPDSE